MVTTTTTYSFKKPTVGDDEDLWGGYLNDSMDLIDDVLDGTTPVTGIDINSGTIDNAVIGGTTAAAGTFTALTANTSLGVTGNITVSGTVDGVDIATRDAVLTSTTTTANAALPKAGGTMTGALNLGDNVKAQFGASADLQIYHNGTYSRISDEGTGSLVISTNGNNIQLAKGTSELMVVAAPDGAVDLYYDNSKKLATTSSGIDVTGTVTADGLTVDAGTSGLIDFGDVTTAYGRLYADSTGTYVGSKTNHALILRTANTERARLDTSGNLLVGQTSANSFNLTSGFGFDVRQTYGLGVAVQDNPTAIFNRTNSDGDIMQFRKDGSTVGSIGTVSSTLVIGSGDTGLLFSSGDDVIIPRNSDTSARDAAIDLGDSGNRFKDLYLSGSAYVGDKVIHDGDTDTYIGFGTDTINFYTGSYHEMQITPSGVFLINSALHEDYDALSGTSPSVDPNQGGAWSLTMTGNTTFTFGGTTSGYSVGFIIQLTGNGSTVTWPSSVDWAGGTAPDAPASGETDILVFWTRDGGTTWYGVQSIDAAS